MRICEISHFFSYTAYRQKAVAMAQLAGAKELLLVPAGWTEDFHECTIEPDESKEYLLKERQAYLNWHIWGGKRTQLYMLSLRIIQDVRNYKPDIIVVDSEPFSLLAFQVALIRRLFFPNTRFVVHSSQNLYKRFPFPFSEIEAFVMRQATVVIARSEEIKQVLLQKGCSRPIHIIPHGVDIKRFSPSPSRRIICQKGKSCLRIGYVGSLVRQKGVHILIEAVAGFNSPFDLTIVGNGPERSSLELLATASPVTSRIQFQSSVPNAQLPDTLRKFDVLVLPSISMSNWKEQFGRIIIEAMACGIPVIGSSSGSIPEVVGDGGLIFNEQDYLDLRRIIQLLYKDRHLLKTLSEKACRRVIDEFSWQAIAPKIYKLYLEITERNLKDNS